VTLLNLFSVGGVGVAQFITGKIYAANSDAPSAAAPFSMILIFFAVSLVIGLVVYLFSTDTRPDRV